MSTATNKTIFAARAQAVKENARRTKRAKTALADYIEGDPHEELRVHVKDLLNDVMHLCRDNGIEYFDVWLDAKRSFAIEVAEERQS